MDLLKSWAVAVGVWLLGSLLTVIVFVNAGSLAQVQSFGGRVTALYIPQLVVALLMACTAAVVHPAPARERAERHAAAVFAVPAVVLVVNVVSNAVRGSALEVYAAALVTLVVGSFVGWWLAGLLRPRRPRRRPSYGYPY